MPTSPPTSSRTESSGPSAALPHVMISASAGSGKTYQLVRRFLHLMTLGVEPQRIAAMTFTRKASGEFFNRILNRLAELAQGTLNPDRYFEGMEPRPEQWPNFAKLLRATTQAMQQLRLGTLDSFFANIAACFPLELGLPLGASVMAEEEAEAAREDVIAGIIERVFRDRDEATATALIEAYKQATFGSEEKRAETSLNDWIKAGHNLWLESDSPSAWGTPARIWSDKSAAIHWVKLDFPSAVSRLGSAVDADALFTEKGADSWRAMLVDLASTLPGLTLPPSVKSLLKACAEVWPDLRRGGAQLNLFRNKRNVSGPGAAALVEVCEQLLVRELLTRSTRTQGTAKLLGNYEKEYARRVRNLGKLSFSDVQRLLAHAANDWLHANEGADLWYRLDARHEHWLFDEFQDTSYQQWHVVEGLVNEVLQSDSGQRSFFAVGDPKQSIYLWRQAEPRLFQQVMEMDRIQAEPLSQSRRSAQQVLDTVNLVCDEEGVASLLPGVQDFWHFEPHTTTKKIAGYSALLWPEKTEGESANAHDVTIRLLQQVRPLERQIVDDGPPRPMTCAILVRGNDTGRELADQIRAQTGMEVVCESEQHPATDNAVTLALLSILQLAAHPGDTYALEHLRMTPLQVPNEDWKATIDDTQRLLFAEGFVGFVKQWTGTLKQALPEMDEFTALRLEQFGDIATEFDATGSRDIDAFLRHARSYRHRTRGISSAIQVMTVHASKGLEFDMVILPELSSTAMPQLRPRSFIAKRTVTGHLDWVLQEPPKDYLPFDPVLGDERTDAENRAAFEGLCRLYVAMTRAKRALYLVLEPPPKEGKSINEAKLLRDLLCTKNPVQENLEDIPVAWASEIGLRDWFLACPHQKPPTPHPVAQRQALGEVLRKRQPIPMRKTPSGEESFKIKGSVLWSTGRDPGRQLGTLVHQLMEQVAWVDGRMDEAALEALWQPRRLHLQPAYEKAKEHALRILHSEACRVAFTKPSPNAKLWRERPFDLMQGEGQWISGTVDRVVVTCDAAGKPTQAAIFDYKTDDVPDAAKLAEKVAGYAPQIALYQQAVARLTGLTQEKISTALLFTRTGTMVRADG